MFLCSNRGTVQSPIRHILFSMAHRPPTCLEDARLIRVVRSGAIDNSLKIVRHVDSGFPIIVFEPRICGWLRFENIWRHRWEVDGRDAVSVEYVLKALGS